MVMLRPIHLSMEVERTSALWLEQSVPRPESNHRPGQLSTDGLHNNWWNIRLAHSVPSAQGHITDTQVNREPVEASDASEKSAQICAICGFRIGGVLWFSRSGPDLY